MFREDVAELLAIAPDGRRIVVNVSAAGRDRVYVRDVGQLEFAPVHKFRFDHTLHEVAAPPDSAIYASSPRT